MAELRTDRATKRGASVSRAEVRELVQAFVKAQAAGEQLLHMHPAVCRLSELCGPMAGYYVMNVAAPDRPPAPVDEMVDHILRHAPAWTASAARVAENCRPRR